jgi:hypothetical protein
MTATLVAIGVALRILGVIVTAIGLGRTWRDFPPGERFLEPVLGPPRRIVRAVSSLRERIARSRRRRRHVHVEPGAAIASILGFDARIRIDYGPIQPGTPEDQIAVLDNRTREIQARLNAASERLDESIAGLRDDAKTRDADTARRLADLELRDVRIATGGVRLAAFGLLLIGLGELLELVAPVFE